MEDAEDSDDDQGVEGMIGGQYDGASDEREDGEIFDEDNVSNMAELERERELGSAFEKLIIRE